MSGNKRVLVCEFHQETNTFNPIPTGLEGFAAIRHACGQEAYDLCRELPCAFHGMTDAIEAAGGEVIPSVSLSGIMGGRLAEAFAAKPRIEKNCVGCGVCERSCPAHAITIQKTGSGKRASIAYKDCIRCYCCQELCPHGAVGMKGNILVQWIH